MGQVFRFLDYWKFTPGVEQARPAEVVKLPSSRWRNPNLNCRCMLRDPTAEEIATIFKLAGFTTPPPYPGPRL